MSVWQASVQARIGSLTLDVELGGAGVIALVGPNGSGKTTVLRLLAGAITADACELVIGGVVVESSTAGVRLPIEARRLGYVPQGYGLFPHLDALDNVAFGLSTGASAQPRAQRREAARRMLEDLGCGELAERDVLRLSGGERQRVALARALVVEPALLLLDEPLAALDASTRRSVREFLGQRLHAIGRPTLLVTHDVRDVAALADHVYVIESGRIVQDGPLEALRSDPQSAFVEEWVA
jgi:ABC-type sulfate/molybdate transport systems ATPase subunit